jgi:hypothetical protein
MQIWSIQGCASVQDDKSSYKIQSSSDSFEILSDVNGLNFKSYKIDSGIDSPTRKKV